MFWKKPILEDPDVGTLTFLSDQWMSESISTPCGEIWVSIGGDRTALSPEGLIEAKKLASNPDGAFRAAAAFIHSDAGAQEFIKGNGELVFNGFSITPIAGKFKTEFSLSNWSDAMISVEFENGLPYDVSLAD
jgi:hypothetical protein